MRRMIYIFCLLAASCCLAQSAATARLGALGRNDSIVTNVTFGGPASRLTDGTNIITSARDVYETVQTSTEWSYVITPPGYTTIRWLTAEEAAAWGGYGAGWYYDSYGGPGSRVSEDPDADHLEWDTTTQDGGGEWVNVHAVATRKAAGKTYFVGRLALTNDIPEISTNNAAFVAAVTNCPVVIAAADGITLGEFGEYGTLGSLLAALAAAITWLKANKANKTDLPYEIHAVTVTSGAGTLADRAVNVVTLSADATLTLPAAVVVGGVSRVRDLLVDLTVSGTPLPDVTFAGATGETVTFVAEEDSSSAEFAVPSAAGEWLYSFTEISAGKFAVALKQVSTVTQGGGA